MVNMVLDSERAKTFDCSSCDYALQVNRNCLNRYSDTKIILNQVLYKECPRGMILNKREERFLVDLYFDCKNKNIYPHFGSEINQTAYCIDLFDFIGGIVNKYQERIAKEQKSKEQKSTQDMRKGSTKK